MAAPVISQDVAIPSTPSQEWANKTASSLSPDNLESASNIPETNQRGGVALASTTSTPGYDIPGAYPREHDVQEPFVVGDAKSAALGVYNTAKSYIPAPGDVEKVVITASETAKQYLPAAVTSYFPSQTAKDTPQPPEKSAPYDGYSLPSQESPSESLGATNGVGALPGSKSESGVAKLPAERSPLGGDDITPASAANANIDTSFLTPQTNANAHSNGGMDSMSNVSIQAQDGSEVGSETSAASSLHAPTLTPSANTTFGSSGKKILAPLSASGDTLHPEERTTGNHGPTDTTASKDEFKVRNKHILDENTVHQTDIVIQPAQEPILNTTARTHPLGKDGTKWKGVPLSEGYQTKLDANSERQLNLNTHGDHTSSQAQNPYQTSNVEKAKDEAYAVKDKVLGATTNKPSASTRPANLDTQVDSTKADVGHSPAEKHGRDGSTATNASFPSATKDATETQGVASSASGSSKASSGNGGSPHKSKFMDRIKGEVKVISGKLAHNEEKVEEGRRLMGKSA